MVVDQLSVGRLADSGLVLSEGHPSRRHAMIHVAGDETRLEDLGSANGTFVNDHRISSPVVLHSGDKIRFDTEEFVFSAPAVADDNQATMIRNVDDVVDVDGSKLRQQPDWVDPSKHVAGGPKTEFFDVAQLKEQTADRQGALAEGSERFADPVIMIMSGSAEGRKVVLKSSGNQGQWTIGCDADRDIVLDDKGISAVHAKLTRDGKRWKLSDQMSTSGTFVNGKRSNVSYLDNGDRLRFGPVECIIHLPKTASSVKKVRSRTKKSSATNSIVLAVLAFLISLAVLYVLFGR